MNQAERDGRAPERELGLWMDVGSAFIDEHEGRFSPIIIEQNGTQHRLESYAAEGQAVEAIKRWASGRDLRLLTGMFTLRKVIDPAEVCTKCDTCPCVCADQQPDYIDPGFGADERRGNEHARPELIVMLLPANRPEQAWWQDLVEPFRDRPGSDLRTEFLRGRQRFVMPGAEAIGPNERPPFGCCLLIWQHIGPANRSLFGGGSNGAH